MHHGHTKPTNMRSLSQQPSGGHSGAAVEQSAPLGRFKDLRICDSKHMTVLNARSSSVDHCKSFLCLAPILPGGGTFSTAKMRRVHPDSSDCLRNCTMAAPNPNNARSLLQQPQQGCCIPHEDLVLAPGALSCSILTQSATPLWGCC